MLKRTKGRLLLTLLVITGMAGTLNVSSLTKEERKVAINQMKDTRTDLVDAVKGLSEAQLNFKPAADRWSIKECVYHIVLTEDNLWGMLDSIMKTPANPDKRKDIQATDEQLMSGIRDRSEKRQAAEPFQPVNGHWKNVAEALEELKKDRAQRMKYVKATTEDFRNRVIAFPFGSIDSYQFMIFISGHAARHTLQIKEIKADPGFPAK